MSVIFINPYVFAVDDGTVAGFSSFTFGGPFISGDWSIGTAGTTPYGVGIKSGAVDEPIHDASGSIM
jgi:hypothetical protein